MILVLKGEFAVVPTDKICGWNLSKIPVDMNSIFTFFVYRITAVLKVETDIIAS
jgi:hypothetical protein